MATAVLCPECDKQEGIVPCLGCKKVFCVKHFQTHRQNLSVDLENVVTRRNTLQEYYYSTIAATLEPTKLAAWKTIDEWEHEVQAQVRRTADEARKQLGAFSQQSQAKIEQQLKNITEDIQRKMERENFIEDDIEKLAHQIDGIEDGIRDNKYHPQIEIVSQPVDWTTVIQVNLQAEPHSKTNNEEKLPTPTAATPVATPKPDYPRSIQRKCFSCGRDTWQKDCKCCNQVYCGWHMNRHSPSSKKH